MKDDWKGIQSNPPRRRSPKMRGLSGRLRRVVAYITRIEAPVVFSEKRWSVLFVKTLIHAISKLRNK